MNECELPDETLFEQALQCHSAEERVAFLDRVCAGQPGLRRKLEQLLAAHDQSGEFLDRGAVAADATVRISFAEEEQPGTVIGRYKLLQKIGEGGMGAVYMAEQTDPVVRRVALKIIKLGMDTRQVVARFEAERQALALMDHPNIAKVLDAGATDTGRPYFVMELVHGVPITEYCDKNKLSTQARIKLFIPVCQAIQHAHQKGIIHRDIKPSNVMVTLHDGVPVPKVIDFGVAKATNQRLTQKTLFTNYAQIIGTPAYMSPEQAEMSGLDIDTRSDIYSLGVLLYELLTGTTPFDARELLSKGYAEMQRIIAEQEPPKPSTRMSTLTDEQRTVVATQRSTEVGALRRVLQGDLDWIVMKCLEKDRTRRYETSNGLAADLGRHLTNEPVVARPPNRVYRLRKLIARHRMVAGAVVAVMTALLLGAIGTGIGWADTKKALARAETAEAQAVNDRNTAVEEKGKAEEASRRLAKANETLNQKAIELRRALYTSTMGSVHSAIKANDIGRAHDLLTAATPEERGWEWSLMHWFTDRSIDTAHIEPPGPRWDEHGWITFRSSFNPDGTRAATAHPDGTVTIWDVGTGKPLRSFQAYHKDSGEEYFWGGGIGSRREPPITHIDWVLNGRRLVTVSGGLLAAKLWDPETGNSPLELEEPSLRLQSLHSIADGSRLLAVPVVGNENRIKEPCIWDMQSGKILCTLRLPATNPPITSAEISPDGRWAAGGTFPNAFVWDANTGHVVAEPKLKEGDSVVAISSDGRLLATSRRVIDVQTGEELRRFETQSGQSGTFSSDGRLLALHQSEHVVAIVHVHSQQEPRLILSPSVIEGLRFSEDNKTLITTGRGIRRVWDLSPDPCFAIRNIPGGVVGFSSDGRQLAIREFSETLSYMYPIQGMLYLNWPARRRAKVVWLDVQTGQRLRSVDCGTTVLDGPHYDGKRIVVLEKEEGEGNLERFCRARVIDPETGRDIGSIRGLPGLGQAVAISADGKYVAVARWWFDGFPFPDAVNVIDMETGAVGPSLQGLDAPATKLAFSPNGRYLTAGSTGECVLFETQSGRQIARVKGLQTASSFSPDSARVLIAGYSTGLRVLDSATGRELTRLRGQHEGAAFSPDGRRLVSTVQMIGGSQSITVWDAGNFNELASVPLGASEIYFSPDGHRIAATSWGGSVLIVDCQEPAADVRAARQALRISQTAADLVSELRTDRDGIFRTDDEGREKIEADKNLEPEVRAAALLALKAPDPEAPEKLSRFLTGFRNPSASLDTARLARGLRMAEQAAAQAPNSSTNLHQLGQMQYWSGQYEAAEATLKRAEELHRKEHAQPDPWNLLFSALTQFKLGKTADAKSRLADALAQPADSNWDVRLAENPLLLHAEQVITGLELTGYAEAASTHDVHKLVEFGLKLAAGREAEFGKAHPATVRSLAALAASHADLGQWDEAAKAFAAAYEAASLGTNAAVRAERLRELLEFLQKRARFEDGVQLAMLAAELRERAAHDDTRLEDLHLIVEAQANVLKRLEKRGEEEACRREVLQLCEQIHGALGEHTIGALGQLAQLLMEKRDSDGADTLLVAHLDKLNNADEASLFQRERLLGWLADDKTSVHPDARLWPGRLIDTSRKLCEAQISRCTGQLKTTPLDPEALASRAFAYTRLGEFKKAASDYDLKIRLDPRNHWHWFYLGCLLAMLDDQAAYRQHCRAMLERYGDTTESGEANRVVKTALLLPLPPEETARCLELLNRTLNESDAWDQLNKGIAEIRCERYSAAIEWLIRCRDESQNDNRAVTARRAAAQFYLAMAYHRSGQATQSRKEMREAAQLMDTKMPKAGRDDLNSVGVENWLVCQVARRQATMLCGSGEIQSAQGR